MSATVKAYISDGRWVADCPQCNCAEVVRVGQPFKCGGTLAGGFHGAATACGFVAEVEFPADKLAIEKALIDKPVSQRNWKPAAEGEESNEHH